MTRHLKLSKGWELEVWEGYLGKRKQLVLFLNKLHKRGATFKRECRGVLYLR